MGSKYVAEQKIIKKVIHLYGFFGYRKSRNLLHECSRFSVGLFPTDYLMEMSYQNIVFDEKMKRYPH
ncbi:hypothetical protein B7492_19310 [Bacillus mycoides]|uniref:Uncharacterized protein n=1 Tax=Bacillus mycoides TaxID=1405 RepID=A0A1W6ABB4_BACMY|nr:hypothetical protein B7492_19310 [Bacillus mycoides]